MKNFRVLARHDLPDFRARGILLEHEPSGAQVYRIETADPENLFAFCFRTPAEGSTGVAHILEHTVLCGSRRYPLKDPFINLAKSSLNTFLNAMTYPDKTIYPASSLVEADYRNLMDVYADAVFFPLLKPEAFRQEGHHTEWDGQNLKVTGVVFNEMKGNYSSEVSVMSEEATQALYDQGPYHGDSGGDPRRIPELTYEAFQAFHNQYYHPANSLTVLYGSFELEPQLERLEERVFRHFPRRPAAEPPALLRPWTQPRSAKVALPTESEEVKHSFSLGWLTGFENDPEGLVQMDLLSDMLLGDAGLLSKRLLDSGLGEDLLPITGFETELRQTNLTLGLRGVKPEDRGAFESLVFEELGRLAREGFPKELIEATLRVYEFSLREVKGRGQGLRVLRRLLRAWNYGQDLALTLSFSGALQKVRRSLEAGEPLFQNLIRRSLLENPHRLSLWFYGDPEFGRRLEADIAQAYESRQPDAAEQARLAQEAAALEAFQNEDDPAVQALLPLLTRDDLPRTIERYEAALRPASYLMQAFEGLTNDIAYLDLGLNLAAVPPEDYELLHLLGRLIEAQGLKTLSYDLVARALQTHLGGFSFRVSLDLHYKSRQLSEHLWFRAKFRSSEISAALELLGRLFTETAWDDLDRLKDLLLEVRNKVQNSLAPEGHHYALSLASAPFHPAAALGEIQGGVTALARLKESTARLDRASLSQLSSRLRDLWARIFHPQNLKIGLCGESPFLGSLESQVRDWVSRWPAPSAEVAQADSNRKNLNFLAGLPAVILAPWTVSYAAWTFPVPEGGPVADAARLYWAHSFSTSFLWEEVRMKGGAYGAFAQAQPSEGLFSFVSYRDPHLASTLKAYERALESAASGLISQNELDRTLIGVVGADITPLSPADQAWLTLQRRIKGITDDDRQARRDAYFALTPPILQTRAQELIETSRQGRRAALCGLDLWEAEGPASLLAGLPLRSL